MTAVRSRSRQRWGVVLVLALVNVSGCKAERDYRIGVQGRVTLDEQPLEEGSITFHSANGGSAATAEIVNGQYRIPAAEGPQPGYQVVRVFAFRDGKAESRPVGGLNPGGMPAPATVPAKEQFLHANYNTESRLEVFLGQDQNDTVDFNLTSAGDVPEKKQ